MAQGDSVGRDLDKKTRALERTRINPGDGLSAQQIAQNQLQAIQNEQRNNISQARVQAQAAEQVQQVAVQAAQIGTMENGPAVETMKKYGLTKPRTIKTQSHEIKMAPPNITINNTTNNTVTGGGPTAGREVSIKPPVQAQNSTNKFKTWLSGLLLSQKEANAKREREFDRRDSVLVRSSNKMLKRIEAAGRDIATNLNPKVIGTTVGNQFRMLLMIFALGFLAKHWEKVMDVLDKIVGFFKNSLDYFGITNRQDGRPSPFYQDLLGFFGAKNDENSLFQVFGRLGKELIEYLKMKLDHAMSLRGDAIKNIKFPELDTNDIFKTLSSIAGYVGNILTAMMDPKKGVADSIKREVNSSMTAVQRDDAKERIKFSDEIKGQGLKDTSYGDYAAVSRQTLTSNALDASGGLRNNTWASLSQGRDLMQAYNNSKNGDIDIARMGGGLQRLQDTASNKGFVTLDAETINQLFGDKLQGLLRSGDIQQVPMKYIRVKKTDADLADEDASPKWGAAKGYAKGIIISALHGGTTLSTLKGAGDGIKAGSYGGGVLGTTVGVATGTTQAGGWLGAAKGYMEGTAGGGAALGYVNGLWNKMFADDYTLKLVPAEDPRPGVALNGNRFFTYYKVNPKALNRLASIITNNSEITKIDSGSEQFMRALEKNLVARAGGERRVRSRDYDLNTGYQAVRNLEERENFYKQEEQNSDFARSMSTIGNNGKRFVNNAYQGLGSAISTVGSYITSFSSGGSNQIRNWLWGGSAPVSYRPGDAAHMSAQMVRVTFPIHNMSGRESQHTLTVHRYLADDVKAIFNEIFFSTNFKIDPSTTAAFVYRPMKPRRQAKDGGPMLSNHAFGSAIDINWTINPLKDTSTINTDVHLGTKSHPVVQIFYRHSWKWLGKDATGKFADPMHFEYAGKPGQVGQQVAGAQMGYMSQAQSDANNAPYASQVGTYPTTGGGFSVSGSASFSGGGGITYQAQGSYTSGPVIPATNQAVDMTNSAEGSQKGKTAGFNNPGNLCAHSAFGQGVKNGFAVYDNLEDGFADAAVLMTKYLSGKMGTRRNPSIREILNKYCPGNNGTYIQNLANWTGLGTDTPIPLTYNNVLKLVGGITKQEHSSILSKKDYVAGVQKGWNAFMSKGGQPDEEGQPIAEGDNPNMMAAGDWLNDLGQGMQNGVIFDDVKSPEEMAREQRFSENVEKMMHDGFNPDPVTGKYVGNGYYKEMYGDKVTSQQVEAAWRKDSKKMNRDMKYSPMYTEADKIWNKFHTGEEDIRREILNANSKEEFRKFYSGLSWRDKNRLIGILNQYVTKRYRGVKNYDGVHYKDRRNIMDVFGGDERIVSVDQKTKDLYAKYMSTGQFDKAKKLIESTYDPSKATNNAYRTHIQHKLDAALNQHQEGKSYLLHDSDDYRQGYAANAKLEKLEDRKRILESKLNDPKYAFSNNSRWKEELNEISTEIDAVRPAAEQFKSDKKAYTKYDNRVETISDAAAFKSLNVDKEVKKNLDANKKILELEEKLKNGGTFSTEEEADKAIAQWKKELEQYKKDRDESMKHLNDMVGDDQKDLLAKHKKDVKELYEKSGKNVNEAEKRYLELIKQGKSHTDAMIEIQKEYDSQVVDYLNNFGETIVAESKKIEEQARKKLQSLIANLAGVSLDDVDLDGMKDLTTGEAVMRSAITPLIKSNKPVSDKGLSDKDKKALLNSGYQYDSLERLYIHPDYTVVVDGQKVKWKPKGGLLENYAFYEGIKNDSTNAENLQFLAGMKKDVINKLDEISGKQGVIANAIGQNNDLTANQQFQTPYALPSINYNIGSWTKNGFGFSGK